MVLPRLAARGLRIQFAFINGCHTHDHNVARMLDPGAYIVLDDVGYPSIKRLSLHVAIVANRPYSIGDVSPRPFALILAHGAQAEAQRFFARRYATSPRRSGERPVLRQRLTGRNSSLLRKDANDARRRDHLAAF
jgi:hypothetical protein